MRRRYIADTHTQTQILTEIHGFQCRCTSRRQPTGRSCEENRTHLELNSESCPLQPQEDTPKMEMYQDEQKQTLGGLSGTACPAKKTRSA